MSRVINGRRESYRSCVRDGLGQLSCLQSCLELEVASSMRKCRENSCPSKINSMADCSTVSGGRIYRSSGFHTETAVLLALSGNKVPEVGRYSDASRVAAVDCPLSLRREPGNRRHRRGGNGVVAKLNAGGVLHGILVAGILPIVPRPLMRHMRPFGLANLLFSCDAETKRS
jgi:hypothetical protein